MGNFHSIRYLDMDDGKIDVHITPTKTSSENHAVELNSGVQAKPPKSLLPSPQIEIRRKNIKKKHKKNMTKLRLELRTLSAAIVRNC